MSFIAGSRHINAAEVRSQPAAAGRGTLLPVILTFETSAR